jgi:hypothetical protein
MKKLMLLAVAGLIFVSCGNRPQSAVEEVQETTQCEAMLERWAGFDELELEDQVVLIGEMKAFLDECKAEKEEKCPMKEEGAEVCPEKAAKCAEFKAKWEAFETLELDAQKEMINCIINHLQEGCGKEKKEGCCKKDKEECTKE